MVHRHPILSLLTLAYLGLVASLTLGPQPLNSSNDGWLLHLVDIAQAHRITDWITYDRIEFGANVAMFVPIGLFFLLLLGRRRWWLAILLGFALTVGIETAQLYIPGRVSDIRDIVANTTGAVVGVVFGLLVTAPKARRLRLRLQARAARRAA